MSCEHETNVLMCRVSHARYVAKKMREPQWGHYHKKFLVVAWRATRYIDRRVHALKKLGLVAAEAHVLEERKALIECLDMFLQVQYFEAFHIVPYFLRC